MERLKYLKKKKKRQQNKEIKYSNQNVCEYIKWNLMKMSFCCVKEGKKLMCSFLPLFHMTRKKGTRQGNAIHYGISKCCTVHVEYG